MPTKTASPMTPPTTAPAIVAVEVFLLDVVAAAVASLSVAVLDNEDAIAADETLLDSDDVVGAIQPREEGADSAKPSMGCA